MKGHCSINIPIGKHSKSYSEAEPLASLLSAPGFQHRLRSREKENELAEKDSKLLFLGGKRKPLLRPLQLRGAIWKKARDQKSRERRQLINSFKKSAAGIREKKPLQHARVALEPP